MKNTRIFYLEIFPFLLVKFSIYLNRRVFVMDIGVSTVKSVRVRLAPFLIIQGFYANELSYTHPP